MIRLFYREGPFDGGYADFDEPPRRSKKASKGNKRGRTEPPELPRTTFVACGDGSAFAWAYHITRTITPYSAEYRVCGWVKLEDVPDGSILMLIGV